MNPGSLLGPWLVVTGVVLIVVGVLLWWGVPGWLGRLPGDLRIEGESTRVYLPITTMILLSAVLTIVVNLLRRFF